MIASMPITTHLVILVDGLHEPKRNPIINTLDRDENSRHFADSFLFCIKCIPRVLINNSDKIGLHNGLYEPMNI